MPRTIDLEIYNVGNGNFVYGTTMLGDSEISFCIDAGSRNTIPNISSVTNKLCVDIFFLTHWHYDHYSFFTLPNSSFRELVHYYPKLVNSDFGVADIVDRLHAKKARRIENSFNLDNPVKKYGVCPSLGGFTNYSINIAPLASDNMNDWSVTYYLSIGSGASSEVTVRTSRSTDSISISNSRGLYYFPIIVFPGDAKENYIGYLSMYCMRNSIEIPIYMSSHHGSPYSTDISMHNGYPFGDNTHYIISGSRYFRSPKTPSYIVSNCHPLRRYYFTNEDRSLEFIGIEIRES